MTLRILLADSSTAAQKIGTKILAAAGYDVITVSNGVAAIKKIAELHPDLVLLDVHMAGYSGIEVCKKMKATVEIAQIPILLTVGKMEPFDAGEASTAKAHGLVTKPFDDRNLISAVENVAGRPRFPEPVASPLLIVHGVRIASAFSRQQDSEVCDVCGHVNRGVTYSCKQCDVPLPSSVRTHVTRS